jgi:organic radical activating enzyme
MKQPVKIQTYDKFPYKFVEWKLHDKCNYDCPFCGDENKKGVIGWQDFETNKQIIDSIAAACQDKPFWIQLTGGEPTLYPKFIELVKYMKEKGAYTSLISNGSRTIRWWKQLVDADVLDLVYLTFHSQQQADYNHLAEVSNLFYDKTTVVINMSTYTIDTLDYLFEGLDYLMENTGNIIVTNAMDTITYRIDEAMIGKERFDKLLKSYNIQRGAKSANKKSSNIPFELMPLHTETNITYDNNTTETKNVIQMMKTGENRFEGWDCFAGIDSMNIENGIKFRGGCKRDQTPFEPNNLTFYDKPFKCDVVDCYCGMDMITTKIKTKV